MTEKRHPFPRKLTARDRRRARVGLHWQPVRDVRLFYGLSWLSEEFEGQHEAQVLGSLKLEFGY